MRKYYIISITAVVICVLVFAGLGAAFAYLYPLKYTDTINEMAEVYDIDPALVAAVINVESGFDKTKVSPKGAIGLMQIMPTTAMDIAIKLGYKNFEVNSLFDEKINIEFGCYYLSYLHNLYDDDTTKVLASYNAGLSNVNTWLQDDTYSNVENSGEVTLVKTPYVETNNFIKRVNSNYNIYSKKI